MGLLEDIIEKSGISFRPAPGSSVDQLGAIGVPEDALAFYRTSEPSKCAEIDGVRLWPISEILSENKDYVPGCYIHPFGYVVFSTTLFGDAFCFDTNTSASKATAPVVLIAHDLDWEEMKHKDIAKLAKRTATSFQYFLEAYASGTLDIEPLYPE
jgi:hypothetical protein